jgi:hypothetical protein
MAQKSGYNYRSSVSGKFVKPGYAKQHPTTTEKERRK